MDRWFRTRVLPLGFKHRGKPWSECRMQDGCEEERKEEGERKQLEEAWPTFICKTGARVSMGSQFWRPVAGADTISPSDGAL
jgi:hypothetical protein